MLFRSTITAGQVVVEHPRPSSSNSSDESASSTPARRHVSRPLLQVLDRSSLLVHWTPHDPEWTLLESYRALGQAMPVAIALGGDPLLMYAAGAPLPPHVDPLVFAGFLRRQPVEVVRGRSIDVLVPANADFIIEGHIDPQRELEVAPPIGLPTGF